MQVVSRGGPGFDPEKLQTTYLYIDGNYLHQEYRDRIAHWFDNNVEIDYGSIKRDLKAKKVFFYDCIDDLKQDNETDADFQKRVEFQEEAFNKIRELEGFHIRQGVVTGKTRRSKRQKEVDILLAVDMLTHSFRRLIDNAVLLSGDRDFKPLVETLVHQMGINVTIVSDPRTTSTEYGWAADSWKKLTFDDYWGWTSIGLRGQYPRPDQKPLTNTPINLGWTRISKTIWENAELELYQGGGEFCIYCQDSNNQFNRGLLHSGKDKLLLFFDLKFGKTEWV